MLSIYRAFKIVILVITVSLVAGVVYLENTDKLPFDENGNAIVIWGRDTFHGIQQFIVYDPYYGKIIAGLEQSRHNIESEFVSLVTGLSNLTTRKEFYNNIFIFMVSKKMENMENIVQDEFGKAQLFKDLIILDQDKNMLYKYGNSGFTMDIPEVSNILEIKNFKDAPGFIQKYSDPTLDYKLSIILLIDTNNINALLKSQPFPAIFILNGNIYGNAAPFADILDRVQSNPQEQRKYYTGMTVNEVYSISYPPTFIGTLVINYPTRSLGSNILMLLKFILLLALALILIFLDRMLAGKLKTIEKWKKGVNLNKEKPNMKAEEEEKNIDARLDWFEHYVKGNEEKKDE